MNKRWFDRVIPGNSSVQAKINLLKLLNENGIGPGEWQVIDTFNLQSSQAVQLASISIAYYAEKEIK